MKFKIAPGTATKEGFQPGTEEGWINTHQDGMSWVKLSISAGWTYTHYQLGPHKDWYDASSKYRTVLEKIEGIKNPEEVPKGRRKGDSTKFEYETTVKDFV